MDDTSTNAAIAEILDYWFGQLDATGKSPAEKNRLWFSKDVSTDAEINSRFSDLHRQAVQGSLDHWADGDAGLIALIVLLDQFSRNLYRNSAQAFAADAKALAIALTAIADGRHQHLPAMHQVFLYLPLEHSENLANQNQCVALFKALAEGRDDDFQGFLRYAVAHKEVIERFGRFPHRNALLNRESSSEELAYLKTHGGF